MQGIRRRNLVRRVVRQAEGDGDVRLFDERREDGVLLLRKAREPVNVQVVAVQGAVACEHFREPVEPVGGAGVRFTVQCTVGLGDEGVVGELVGERRVLHILCGGAERGGIQPRGAQLCHDLAHPLDRADVRAFFHGFEQRGEPDERAPHENLLGGGARRLCRKAARFTEDRIRQPCEIGDFKGQRSGGGQPLCHHPLAGDRFLLGDNEKYAPPVGERRRDGVCYRSGLSAPGITEDHCQHSVFLPSLYPRPREENMRLTPSFSILRRR